MPPTPPVTSAGKPERRKRVLTPAQLEAARRNLEKANRAVRAGRRPFTEAMTEAARKNLAKGRDILNARGRTPEHIEKLRHGAARARTRLTRESHIQQARKILSHGFYSRLLRDTAQTLGENPADYDQLHARVLLYLNPGRPEELGAARLLADALWRYHRLYFAQARQQLRELLFFLRQAPPLEGNSADELGLRGYALINVLLDQKRFWKREWNLLGSIERLLRRLIRLRTGSEPSFRTRLRARPKRDPLDEIFRISRDMDDFLDKLEGD